MKNLLIVFFVHTFVLLQAQQVHKCATPHVIQEHNKLNPGYAERVKFAFEQAKVMSKQSSASRSAQDTVYKIKTVFHVVYTSPAENLDDSVILSQLRVLNEDFRRTNADTANTRSIFKPYAVDAGIEFELATEDPFGNPTTGITHTQGNPAPSFFGGYNPSTDDVKSAAAGGVDPWPASKYLNIWVCNIFGGLGVLGYAFPPAAPLANWGSSNPNADSTKQGVVLHYTAVGANNPAPIAPEADAGRSATHEVGHYLGLRHIWGDDQDFFGTNAKCEGDVDGGTDGIDDTPDAKGPSQQTCNLNLNSCPDPNMSQDYPDQVENFMDYSDDACLNMFTKGQVDLMRSVLELYRPGIVTKVVNTPSGIQTLASALQFRLFPNPANSELHVVLTESNSSTQLKLFNQQGALLRTKVFDGGATKVNVSDLPSGVYHAVLQSDNAKTSGRFIKN